MEDVIQQAAAIEGRHALASLVDSSGSIPMSERAKMLVSEDGQVTGTIGGGCLEAEIINCGREVLESGQPHVTEYTMTEEQAGESGLNCGGSVRIYTEQIDAGSGRTIFSKIIQAKADRVPCVLATVLAQDEPGDNSHARVLFYGDGESVGSFGSLQLDGQVRAQIETVLIEEEAVVMRLDAGGLDPESAAAMGLVPAAGGDTGVEVFLEPFVPPPVLYIFGGGHVGAQIARLAKNVGFYVIIVDDRPAFANKERHPDADECLVAEDIPALFQALPLDNQSYIVAASRGHQLDEVVVRQAIQKPARYIGMLGSERKKVIMWKRIEAEVGCGERLDQVHAPIGFNIGADNPEEIAVSVLAELIDVRRGDKKEWKTKKKRASSS
jgi:xanthine dehydrogenase accessory factor